MAKKRSKANRRKRSQAARARQAASPSKKRKDKQIDFREEYRYVLHDLKRMGILAAGIFALLVVLALVLQ